MSDIIKIENLTKIYHENTPEEVIAIQNISFAVTQGEFLCIMGVSGSGKSSLLNIIGCMDSHNSGKILIEDTEISKLDEGQKSLFRNKQIGFVFQNLYLISNLTVKENILLPIIPYQNQSNFENRVNELLNLVNLEITQDRMPSQLSGGQKQRVAICRALINNPSIILADEPTGSLDTKTGKVILELFKKINESRNITIIVVTHDPKVLEYANRVIELKDGRIIRNEIIEKIQN